MSAFLAPIHTWLFNKILLLEELEKDLQKAYLLKYSGDTKDIIDNSLAYGDMIDTTKNLEDIIDVTNIHGWLQKKIGNAETRQAYLITEMINRYGEEALAITKNCYSEQAKTVGCTASIKEIPENPEEIFNVINNYLLEGMPCDRVNRILKCEDYILEWEISKCIHTEYWIKVNGNINIFYNLRRQWLKEFIQSVNKQYKYEFVEGLEYGGIMGVNRIAKK